jgi:beta-glucosidase
LFPFGFGLSYTQFKFHGLSLNKKEIQSGETLKVELTVSNTGSRNGETVVQVYLNDLVATVDVPNHSLIDFQRVSLEAGESKQLSFTIMPDEMMLVDDDGKFRLEPGNFRLEIGSCSPGGRGQVLGAPIPVSAVFTVQ